MEAFPTIQGEGAYAGQAAWFIRLGGCDVGCTWCDVKESWPIEAHPSRSIPDIVEEATAHSARIAVVTGGEPLMHDLTALTGALRAAGFRTHLETSGTHPLSGSWDHICFSPKKFKAPVPGFHAQAHELKVVVYHPSDLAWAEMHAAQMPADAQLYLQPEWGRQERMVPPIVAHVLAKPRWKVSLQTHKYLRIP